MKIRRSLLLSCLLLCCSSHSLPLEAATDTDPVIGTIGDMQLHQSEVLASLGSMAAIDKEALARDSAALQQLVRSLLVQRIVLQQALEKKWDEEPAIQPLLKSTREAAITDSYLKSVSRPPDSYPDEADLKAAYAASRDSFTVPRSFLLAQIFIAAQPGAEEKLKTIQQRLKATPASFAQIARETSEEKDSASRDGEIGWLKEQQIQPEILAQLPQLKLNIISPPIRLKDGWHIIKVLDFREPFTPIFDQVRLQLAQRLRADQTRASMQAYMSELLHNHPVVLNQVALSKLLLAVPVQTAPTHP